LTGTATVYFELAEQVVEEIAYSGSTIQENTTTLIQQNNFATEYDITFAHNVNALVDIHSDKIKGLRESIDELNVGQEEDLRFTATTIRQGVTTKPDFDTTDLVLLFPQNDATEIAYINAQMPHSWQEGTAIEPHIHYIQEEDTQPVFKIDYRWVNIGDAVPSTFTTYTMDSNVMSYVEDGHQMIYGSDGIDGTGYTASSMLQIKLYRDDNVYTGDCKMLEFDIHYKVDKFGKDV
jgi:hypothetical protein